MVPAKQCMLADKTVSDLELQAWKCNNTLKK